MSLEGVIIMGIEMKIRYLMAEHRIDSVGELMERSGLSRNAINRLYKGTDEEIRATNMKTLVALCDVFKCKLSDLIEYTPEEE